MNVITVSVEVDVLNHRFGVENATVTLGVNAIPTIELACAPTRQDVSFTPLVPNLIVPRIADFSEMYRELSVAAEGLGETGTVTITMSGDEEDRIVLKDWILSGAGLSSVGATAAPHLHVVFQHPICKLTKVGSIYETEKTDSATQLNDAIQGMKPRNLLEIMEVAYHCARDTVKYYPFPDNFTLPSEFRQMLGKGEYSPSEYLTWKWDGPGIFLGTGKQDDSDVRKAQAIARSIFPRTAGSSTWDALTAAAGSLLVNVTQDQQDNYTTKHLVLEPMMPWKASSLNIDDRRCASIDLPGANPFRIAGVMSRNLGPYADDYGQGIRRDSNGSGDRDAKTKPISTAVYVPNGVKVSTADGRIIQTSAPFVLDSSFRRDAPYGDNIPQSMVDMKKEFQGGFLQTLRRYCKAVYETSVLSMVRARAQMALSFHVDGSLVLPGNTCRFSSDGDILFYGYIQNVVHHISTGGGNATVLEMSYARPDENYSIRGTPVITAGSANAAYSLE